MVNEVHKQQHRLESHGHGCDTVSLHWLALGSAF